MTPDQITQLLVDVAQLEESIEEIQRQNDRPGWIMNLGDELIFVQYHEKARLLCLSSPIQVPEETEREAFYAMLLRYNAMWLQTGGLSMGLDSDGEDFYLMFPIAANELQPNELLDHLLKFGARVVQWRENTENPSVPSAPESEQSVTDSGAWMRV